jgi:hypothetical protein
LKLGFIEVREIGGRFWQLMMRPQIMDYESKSKPQLSIVRSFLRRELVARLDLEGRCPKAARIEVTGVRGRT